MPTEYLVTKDGVIPQYSFLPSETQHEFKKINVDDGAIQIDHAQHHGNDSHIVLKGDLNQGEKYLIIKTQAGAVLSKIDHTGKFVGAVDAPELDAITTQLDAAVDVVEENAEDIFSLEQLTSTLETNVNANSQQVALVAEHETKLSEATHNSTADKIVQRDESGDVYHNAVTAEIVAIGDSCALYGDASLRYVPQEIVNGQPVNKTGYLYRFGRNEQIGDATGTGDGFRMYNENGNGDNEVFIQVNENTPSIEIKSTKLAEPVIKFRNALDETTVNMDEDGYHMIRTLQTKQISPGTTEFITIEPGKSVYELTLSSDWHPSHQTIFELTITKSASADPNKDFIYTDLAAKDANDDVYIETRIRSQDQLEVKIKLYCKAIGTITNGTVILLYVDYLECV